jgi:hypothetical protein
MEHWLIIGFVDLLLWIDTLSRRKLESVIPNVEELLSHPEETLAVQDITIGPARRFGTGGCLGLLAGLVCAVLAAELMIHPLIPLQGPRPHPMVGVGVLGALLLILLLCVIFMVRFFRGGSMILTPAGVALWYRSTVVNCPWAVFNAPGQPVKPSRDRLVIPISAQAIPLVEAWKHGALIGSGADLKTYQWKLKSDCAAVLKDHYQVRDSINLAGLLLKLGRALGKK